MATNNSSNNKFTNNADGFDIAGGATARKLTVTGADITATGSGTATITFPASTSTLSTIALAETLTSKTLTSPLISNSVGNAAGSIERNDNVFVCTPTSGATGLSPATMFSIVPSGGFNLATTSGVQSAFPSTGDVWTLEGSTTYMFEGTYYISHTTTTATVAMAFAAGGGASATSIAYWVHSSVGAANATATASNMTFVTQIASTVVSITSTANYRIMFKGLLRTNAAGTWTPQINFSANTTAPVMEANSYISFTAMGTNTTNVLGNVA